MRNILIIVVLIFLTGCKATAEQKEYMLEQQGQNFPESQDQYYNN